MAHFYGEVHGSRGKASRLGTKESGLTARLGSWTGGVVVRLEYDEETGKNMLSVDLSQWANGAGVNRCLYYGTADGNEVGR